MTIVVVVVVDVVCVALLMHACVNAVLLRTPVRDGGDVAERVSMLLPMRDEAKRVEPTLVSLLAQRQLTGVELLGYDDESTDDTVDVVDRVAAGRLHWVRTVPLPDGWLGKPHACARLAGAATGTVLVFVDADVVLAPDAVAASVRLLRRRGLAYISPYPRQLAGSWLERLVQPLLQWSWLTFLPLRIAERSSRRSLAAANGQFLIVDAAAYRRAGGHAVVRHEIVDDVELARALAAAGEHGTFVDGHRIASCRMYDGTADVVAGYTKSLWQAFGSIPGAVAVSSGLLAVAVLPWLLVAVTPWALVGAVAGPMSRLVSAARTGSRPLVDVVAHPLSVLALVWLVTLSVSRRRRRRLTWKQRVVT